MDSIFFPFAAAVRVLDPAPGLPFRANDPLLYKVTSPISTANVETVTGTPAVRTIPKPYPTTGHPVVRPNVVPMRILPDYSENFTSEMQQVTHVVDVPWEWRTFFVSACLGDAYIQYTDNPLGGGAPPIQKLRRWLPLFHWEYQWLPCVSCECIGGIGVPFYQPERAAEGDQPFLPQSAPLVFRKRDNQGGIRFLSGYARYQLVFASTMFDYKDDVQIDSDTTGNGELLRFVRREASYAGQGFALESVQLETTDTAEAIGGGFPFREVFKNVTMQWVDVPFVPEAAIKENMGRINGSVFDTVPDVGLNAAAETLLFEGAKIQRRRTPEGRYLYTIEYSFTQRQRSWNEYIGNDLLYHGAQTRRLPHRQPYTTGLFSELFQAP